MTPEEVNYQDRVRKVIKRHMATLKKELEEFEQTTHGLLTPDMRNLAVAYYNPNSYNISNLSQSIDYLLKESN